MTKIVLIGVILFLVWIRIMLPFIRDSIVSNESLRQNPLEQRFHVLLEQLDLRVFDGESIVTVFDEDIQYLQITGHNDMNVSYCLMYSTKNLTIQIEFNNPHRIIDKQYNQIDTLSDAAQIFLAKTIEKETRQIYQTIAS